jgi:hypothetical protein
MKPRSLILFLLPAAACTGTSAPPSPSPPPMTIAAASPVPSPPTLTLEVDVVMFDPAAPSVTLRAGDVPPLKSPKASDIKKGDRTIKLDASTLAGLSAIKPGDRVSITCRQVLPAADAATPASPGAFPSTPPATAPPSGPPPTGLALCESIVTIAKVGGTSPAP